MSISTNPEETVDVFSFPEGFDFKSSYVSLLAACLTGDDTLMTDHVDQYILLDAERIRETYLKEETK